MAGYQNKWHIGLDSNGYMLSQTRQGQPYYQKKLAPAFVNKFGSGDSSYRDSTFWQYWAQTNWRNGAKQLRLDDPGKFWKSSDVDVTELEEITLSRALTLIGQTASGVKVNALASWRTSQSWWNANYGYRKQLTIIAPAASQLPLGYPIKTTEDTATLQTAGKVRSDRNDWRIVYFNGSTWVDLTRFYADTTTTWFPLQAAIPAGNSDTNYYLYYGYSSESTTKQASSNADFQSVFGPSMVDVNTKIFVPAKDTSGTTATDISGNSHNGTLTSTTFVTMKMAMGMYSLSNCLVNFGSHSDYNLGSFTIDYFFTSTSGFATETPVVKIRDGGTDKIVIYGRTSNKVGVKVVGVSGTANFDSSFALTNNTEYHIAVTYDGSSAVKLYINGSQDATGTASGGLSYSGTATLEVSNTPGASVFHKVSYFRVSNVARTSFPHALADPAITSTSGTETTTQPPSSSADVYAGCSNGKVYKFDGVSAFSEVFDTRRIEWYDVGDDTNVYIGSVGGTEYKQGQSFQITTAQKIGAVSFYINNANAVQGLTLRIETNSATIPSGTLVDANATVNIASSTITSLGWYTVEFSASFSLTASTVYWIVLQSSNFAGETGNYNWRQDTSSPTYSNGNSAQKVGAGAWAAGTNDNMFRLLGETTSVNDFLVSSVGGTRKLLMATGDSTSQTNGNAKLYSYDGSNYALEKVFTTVTEAQISKLAEFNGKLYAGVGPQARIYEGTSPTAWTLSKDIDVPQNPGYIYALKEYNGRLYAGGGNPEFLYDKHYNGFWYSFDTTTWSSLYPFDFTTIRSFEFYDAFLFGSTYHGHIFVYDTSTLNPLFNFVDGYSYRANIMSAQLYDDKIYFFLYPQDNSNETNIGVWVFDRHGMSLAHTKSGVTGFRCAANVNNILYIGTGDSGNVYKLDTTNYATQGFVQTSYFDANLPSINKLYNAVIIQHDPLVAGESVVVYYKFKESDSWTTLGTSNTVGDISKTLSFPSATFSKKISLKIELNTTNTAVTPKVNEVVMQYLLLPAQKWMWTMKLIAKKNLKLLDGTLDSNSATTIRSNIETSQNGQKLVTFVDIDSTSYTVLFSELDQTSWVVNQSDVNENEIAVTLIQA